MNTRTDTNTMIHLKDERGEVENNFTFLFSRCISNDAIVSTPKGDKIISEIPIGSPFEVISYDLDKKSTRINNAVRVNSGKKIVYEIESEDGHKIKASADHIFFIDLDGKIVQKRLNKLQIGDRLIISPIL